MDVYPLKFAPVLKEKIWGGRKLAALFGKVLPPGEKIGESWEISHHHLGTSVVCNGPLQGVSLDELMNKYAEEIAGRKSVSLYGKTFPLLIKFIDAGDKLSVQVHPDDAYAHKNAAGKDFGKTECWYVVQADPGARIIKGFNRRISRDEMAERIKENRLEEVLNFFPVEAGDVIFLPAGTVHALLAGAVVAEVQQNSDLTYRIYDWGRLDEAGKPRQLHIADALNVTNFSTEFNNTETPRAVQGQPNVIERFIECDKFILDRHKTTTTERIEKENDGFDCYIFLEGAARIRYGVDLKEAVEVKKGDSLLIPAALEAAAIEPVRQSEFLRTYIPG